MRAIQATRPLGSEGRETTGREPDRGLCFDSAARHALAGRFRHPGYALFRSIVKEELVFEGTLGESTGLLLLSEGIRGVARARGWPEGRIRRLFVKIGMDVGGFLRRVRLRTTEAALECDVPLIVVARWLGFANGTTYCRFIRRELGISVRELRGRLRDRTAPSGIWPRPPAPPSVEAADRHRGSEIVSAAVREELRGSSVLDEESAIVLLTSGMGGLAERLRRSERAVRRLLRTDGERARTLLRRLRARAAQAAVAADVPSHVAARWLGFESSASYRRFLRQVVGMGVRDLRRNAPRLAAHR